MHGLMGGVVVVPPCRIHIGDLTNTKNEPLAVKLRYFVKKRGVGALRWRLGDTSISAVDVNGWTVLMRGVSARGHIRRGAAEGLHDDNHDDASAADGGSDGRDHSETA
jgi:hypothetical protein